MNQDPASPCQCSCDILKDAYKRVVEKATTFFNKTALIVQDPDFRSVFAIAANHGYQYKGPDFNKEMQELQLALKELDNAEKDAAAKKSDDNRKDLVDTIENTKSAHDASRPL